MILDEQLPVREHEDQPESVEVGVIMEGEHFSGYYNYDDLSWWVDLGGITIGHRRFDDYEIDSWYYL